MFHLDRDQFQLISQIFRAGRGRKFKRVIIDGEIEFDAPAVDELINLRAVKFANAAFTDHGRPRPKHATIFRRDGLITTAKAHQHTHLPAFCLVGKQQRPRTIGELQRFHIKTRQRSTQHHLPGRTKLRQVAKTDRISRKPHIICSGDRRGQRHRQFPVSIDPRIGRCRAEDAHRVGGEQRLCRGMKPFRRELRTHRVKHRNDSIGRSHGLTNIDCLDDIFCLLGRGLERIAILHRAQRVAEQGQFTFNIRSRRRCRNRIFDDGAHIAYRFLPVVTDRRDDDSGDIGTAGNILLPDLCLAEAGPAACTGYQAAIEDLLRNRIDQQLLIIKDGVINLHPRPGINHRDIRRQCRLDNRTRHSSIAIRLTEIGLERAGPFAFPFAEILPDKPFQFGRVEIARDHHDCIFRPVPPLVKGPKRLRRGRIQCFKRADGRTGGKPLPLKGMFAHRITQCARCPVGFAQFSLNDQSLGIQRRIRDIRRAHHA